MQINSLTLTYVAKVSMASLNGADKEVDNINPIKKVTLSNGETLPYVSSQAIRRALRDRLIEMGWEASPIGDRDKEKSASATAGLPDRYIEDDLFGYMTTASKSVAVTRSSPIRVESLVGLDTYKGDLDFGTNYMGKSVGANPNIFETEIHSGFYRGTILIELDRVGEFNILEGNDLENVNEEEKAKRVIAFIQAFQNLWSSGRQTRFLADISPKFVAAALMKAKNPVFLEGVKVDAEGALNYPEIQSIASDYSDYIDKHVFASQAATFSLEEGMVSLKEGFNTIAAWVREYYGLEKQPG